MLTLWIIGLIVWILVLFLGYAIIVVGSRADKYKTKLNKHRHAVDTPIVEESASEAEKRDASVKAA